MDALLTLRTVRHLWLSQLKWRLKYRRLRQREVQPGYDLAGRLRSRTAGLKRDPGFPRVALAALPHQKQTWWRDGKLTLLHQERPFSGGEDWGLGQAQVRDRLWMAHLHGHRWLLDLAGNDLQRFLQDWIAVCRPGDPGFADLAWNSYDIATRLLAWSCLPEGVLDEAALESFAMQAEYLHEHVEWDLRANHLLRDAAGLACAGRFLRGAAADRWLQTATDIANGQIDEQVLPDGGHFERSPMYHIHVMEDLRALSCLLRDAATLEKLAAARGRMAEYLAWMRHPDGQVALFNDGGFNGACQPSEVLGDTLPVCRGAKRFTQTGMIAWHGDRWTVFFDAGPIGPDYQPGHAHADSLSVEASFAGRRLFVDPGTYAYDNDARRRYDRSTAAHNTVCVDGLDSSEVWHIFRVGRRASTRGTGTTPSDKGLLATSTHDGYAHLSGSPRHTRQVIVEEARALRVVDRIDGGGSHALSGGWLLAPGWNAHATAEGWRISSEGTSLSVTLTGPEGIRHGLQKRPYHPEYGMEVETTRLCWNLEASRLPAEIVTVVE